MYKVKNILWVLLLAPMFLMFSGCKKFLDRKPLRATLDDLNQGGLEGQVFGMYGGIRNNDISGEAFNGIPWLALHGFRSDDSEKGSDPGDGADWGVIHDQFQYQKDHWSATIYWDQHYTLIGLTNIALQTADSLNLNAPADLVNRGEARFFRAFAYFDLVRTYGEVPLINFRIYNPNDSKKPKATVTQIYAQIDEDMQYAIANLPSDWNNASGISRYPGRLTRWAAMAFHAKTMLYRQNWAGALGLLKMVMASNQYSLHSNYADLFKVAGENSAESLFEIQAYIGPNNTNRLPSRWGLAQGVRGAGEWDLGWGWNTPTQALVDAYEMNDPRMAATILVSGQSDGYSRTLPASTFDVPAGPLPRKYWNKKVYPEPTVQASTGARQNEWINRPVIRYADVLLMAAEAANELGGAQNAADAVNWVNMVRARARGNTSALPNLTFTTQAAFRTAIKQERRIELAMEGERFFDLVRWGDALTVLGPLGYQNRHRYYPIPQAAIDFSAPILVQNPEW